MRHYRSDPAQARMSPSSIITMNTHSQLSDIFEIPPADSALAHAHFSACLQFETDCWDVHQAVSTGQPDFVLLDARSPEVFAGGHLPRALNLPHRKIVPERLAQWPTSTLFVVYCAGPHCNGAHKAAFRLSQMGRPVKLMIGGITGWLDEGFHLVSDEARRE
jgi:rhodanese-related sulfurtransferase